MTLPGRVLLAVLLVSHAAAQKRLIWRDPGDVSKLDFGGSMGLATQPPTPPYRFLREDLSGTHPKVFVRDANGAIWNMKFGIEVRAESFAWRLARAAGYIVEPNFFVPSGRVLGLGKLTRAAKVFGADGSFRDARFQWRNPRWRFVERRYWSWLDNPFSGTPEFRGLKVVIMLTSNWDNKDSRDLRIGPNTGIFEELQDNRRLWLYSFTDWGSTMGNWSEAHGQNDWHCDDFTRQTQKFVTGVAGNSVQFGFEGHHHDGFKSDITSTDLAWLMRYLGAVTDEQLRAGLAASGATPEETGCFTAALRARLNALQKAATPAQR